MGLVIVTPANEREGAKFFRGWIAIPPQWLTAEKKNKMKQTLRNPPPGFDVSLLKMWVTRRGRPIVLRRAAVQARVRCQYLRESWIDIARRAERYMTN